MPLLDRIAKERDRKRGTERRDDMQKRAVGFSLVYGLHALPGEQTGAPKVSISACKLQHRVKCPPCSKAVTTTARSVPECAEVPALLFCH